MRVYEFTREAQDKPEGINWNRLTQYCSLFSWL